MTASGPAQRVRRILEAARPAVDEIVLGVDTSGDPGTVEACADLADRLLPFESPGTGGGLIGWILDQAEGDWILRLDDDEMPSRALLEALPALTRDREATHTLVRRRWLFPDGGRYITSHPWWPDVQLRLLRNVPGIWRFGGRLHDPPEVLGARRISDTSIYHADCVLRPPADRRAKAARYERMRPGIRSEDFPLNAVYVPEDCLGLETAEVPECDAGLVAQLLKPTEPRGSGVTAAMVTPAREITRHNRFRAVSPGAYAATIRLVEPRSSLPAGTECRLQVEVVNRGDEVWPALHVVDPPLRLGHRWLDAEGGALVAAEGRTLFGASVAPGAAALVELRVRTPEQPGVYVLELDMVHEYVRWFDCAVRMQVSVEPPLWAAPTRAQQPRRGLLGRLRSTPPPAPARARPEDRRFHASYGLDGMDLRLAELLGIENGVFVEAGANDGVSQSNTLLLERSYGWSGLLIEPVPAFAERCRRNRPGIPLEEVALVPFDHAEAEVEMLEVGLMSLVRGAMGSEAADLAHAADGSARQDGLEVRSVRVPARPLSEVLDGHGLAHVDLLVLDVEGWEFYALQGLDLDRHAPRFMLVEARSRPAIEALLGSRYAVESELSHHDVLYRRMR